MPTPFREEEGNTHAKIQINQYIENVPRPMCRGCH